MTTKNIIRFLITAIIVSVFNASYGMKLYTEEYDRSLMLSCDSDSPSSEAPSWGDWVGTKVYDAGSYIVTGALNNSAILKEKTLRTISTKTDINFLMAKVGAVTNNERAHHPEVVKTLAIYQFMLPKYALNIVIDSPEYKEKEAQFLRRLEHLTHVSHHLTTLPKKPETKERIANLFIISGELIGEIQKKRLTTYVEEYNKAILPLSTLNAITPTIIEAAICGFHDDIVNLLSKGANIDETDNKGNTALIWAVRHNRTKVGKLLIDNHANLDSVNNDGTTALIYAAANGNTPMVKLLVDAKANVNAVTIYGNTALIWAVRNNKIEIVKLLIDGGANLDIVDNDSNTAMTWATKRGYTEIMQLLLDAKKLK